MSKSHAPYVPDIRHQMVNLVRAELAPGDPALEFEPTAQQIRNWIMQADKKEADGRTCYQT